MNSIEKATAERTFWTLRRIRDGAEALGIVATRLNRPEKSVEALVADARTLRRRIREMAAR